MNNFNLLLSRIDDAVWGLPLIMLITAVGVIITVRTNFIQIIHLPKAIKYMFNDEQDGIGEVSSFAALCTALSATIGTGNIIGVATAVCSGGPGAIFWLEVGAFFGMATKYAEGFLALRFRHIEKDGTILGGPFYYIQKGMGKKWKWLSILFAVSGLLAGVLGIGTITQVNGITAAVNNYFDPECTHCVSIFGGTYSISVVISGLIVTLCVAAVIFGGLKSISTVSQFVVPFMAVIYVGAVMLLLFCNREKIPYAIQLIVKSAFNPAAFTGGAVGSVFIAIQKGIARGIFSNEAGLGSTPIVAAAARTKEPVRQGLVCMTGTFFDTIIICTMTGLAIVVTDAWRQPGLEGAAISSYAFGAGLPFKPELSQFLLMISLVFFVFTSILGWNYYSEKCLQYLVGNKKTAFKIYRLLYILAVFAGPYMSVSAVWYIADIFNGLMAFPNLVALFVLSGLVINETNEYVSTQKILRQCKKR